MSVAVSGPRSLYYEICNIRESCPISGCTAEFFFFVFPVVKWQKKSPGEKNPKRIRLDFCNFSPSPHPLLPSLAIRASSIFSNYSWLTAESVPSSQEKKENRVASSSGSHRFPISSQWRGNVLRFSCVCGKRKCIRMTFPQREACDCGQVLFFFFHFLQTCFVANVHINIAWLAIFC